MLQEIQEHILWHPLGFIIVSKPVSPCSVTPFFDLSCWNFYPRDSQMYFIYTNLWCTCITYTVCELVLWSLLQNCCFLMEFTWFYVVLRFTEVTISDTVFSCHYCDILPFWLIYCSSWFSQQPMKSIKSSENARLILVVSACTEKLLHCA